MNSPITLLLATRNRDKVKEFQHLLSASLPQLTDRIRVLGLSDSAQPETLEDAPTLEGNALKKARESTAYYLAHQPEHDDLFVLADDTGLEIDALGGAPGVRSARYAAEPEATGRPSYEENMQKVLKQLSDNPLRSARFKTVIAMIHCKKDLNLHEFISEGTLEGEILTTPKGDRGFGYDPIFWVPEKGMTLAEMSLEEKNNISHRARATEKIISELKRHLQA